MHWQIFFIFLLNIWLVQPKNVHLKRQKRWFTTITNTFWEHSTVTSWIPSSCVQIEETVPPCRNVRYLKFPTFHDRPNARFIQGSIIEGDVLQSTDLNWGEYLGFYAPTVTVTNVEMSTAVVEDPRIVVTFAVKGCRPLRLPSDLMRCPPEPSSTLVLEDILPTSTVGVNVQPTTNFEGIENIQDLMEKSKNNWQEYPEELQGSHEENFNQVVGLEPTQALP